ncbi:MAG: helix-turn-helix domain-containing protein [Rhizomicrobium sp.]
MRGERRAAGQTIAAHGPDPAICAVRNKLSETQATTSDSGAIQPPRAQDGARPAACDSKAQARVIETSKPGKQHSPAKKQRKQNEPSRPTYYTLQQAAAECGLSEKTIRREIARKKLRANKLGRQFRIAQADWGAYLAATKVGT